jgi:hypothetical protein
VRRHADDRHAESVAEHQEHDAPLLRAQRHADADLARPLRRGQIGETSRR